MHFQRQHAHTTRYGCLECRDDAELVLSGRATDHVREQYERHLGECRECRRTHRVLHALYEGPSAPPAVSGIREEREFQTILRQTREERSRRWYQPVPTRIGLAVLSATAAALALSLFDISPRALTLPGSTHDEGVASQSINWSVPDAALDGGIDHPAQSYGRIVGGSADVLAPGGQAATSTFGVGTRFDVGLNEAVQVALVGKIVANFTAGSDIEWTTASPNLLELKLDRGLLAIRYDRRPSDPILHVRTPSALVRVVGTVFTVQVDADAKTVVSVLHGEVEVFQPGSNRLLAEVEAGYRFDVSQSTFADVGKIEVGAALPLSNGVIDADGRELQLADGHIPQSWAIPGLPSDPAYRTLAYVPTRGGRAVVDEAMLAEMEAKPRARRRARDDEGEDLIEHLMRDAEETRQAELLGTLERCRELYSDPETRYRSAKCLSGFVDKYGTDPLAVEGYLLEGMLRMDYALDYRAADVAFGQFLRRAPNHPRAEMALYRLWLSATEDGRINLAIERGRKYLQRYPNGKYVGKLLQRFPELKREL